MDTERERMTGICVFSKPVDPMVADSDAGRGHSIITRESLISARVVIAPGENQVSLGIEDFATTLRISAQRGGPPGCIADHDLLAVFPEQFSLNREHLAVRE